MSTNKHVKEAWVYVNKWQDPDTKQWKVQVEVHDQSNSNIVLNETFTSDEEPQIEHKDFT